MEVTGNPQEALGLRTFLADAYKQSGDQENYAAAIGNQGVILRDRGDLDGAMALYKEKERICRQLGSFEGLARSIGNQALILGEKGKRAEAQALAKEALALAQWQRITSLENWLKGVVRRLFA